MSDGFSILVTCEHGGNRIPKGYTSLFGGQEALLESHRGWDPGALPLARALARSMDAPLFYSRVSRLLVDLNRSPHHPRLYSALSRPLPAKERERILRRWYIPYRERVTAAVLGGIESGSRVLHLAVHSFTPVLDGRVREVEIGLLFDPAREREKSLCLALKEDLRRGLERVPGPIRVRLNQPYLGRSDGFPTWLRKRFPAAQYLGIEVEVNQGLIRGGGSKWQGTRNAILKAAQKLVSPIETELPG